MCAFLSEKINPQLTSNNLVSLFHMKLGHRGILTPNSFHSTNLVTWGTSWASKEAKFIKEFNFLGFSHCFSARIEQSSKTSKIQPNCVIFEEVFWSLLNSNWKTAAETKKIKFLDEFCFFRYPTWPPTCETSGDMSSFTLCFEI